MTPDELRLLADEATPWPVFSEYDDEPDNAEGKLMRLAPDLARLCAELGEALDALWNEAVGDSGGADAQVKAALAKLFELNSGADEPLARERTQ